MPCLPVSPAFAIYYPSTVPATKLHQNDLWPIIETDRYNAVSKATADNHVCAAVCIQASIVLWEKSLIGSNQPTNQRQTKLSAVCMTT